MYRQNCQNTHLILGKIIPSIYLKIKQKFEKLTKFSTILQGTLYLSSHWRLLAAKIRQTAALCAKLGRQLFATEQLANWHMQQLFAETGCTTLQSLDTIFYFETPCRQ